jgi:uncharacterized integral membrane protein (TIGR00698 family)
LKYIYGLLLVFAISLISILLANFISIGAVAISILVGAIIGNLFTFDEKYKKGINYSQKDLLSFSIALMGINLDLSILISLGFQTIIIIVVGMVITIFSAIFFAKLFNINSKLALLLGIGNGVCGSSAIAATAPIIKAPKTEIAISVAIVNLLGTIGIFLLPFIVITFGLTDIDAGILIGNTLQAVGHVTASGFSINETTGISATTVKMGRVLLLTPLILILIYIFVKLSKNKSNESETKISIPIFIIFFIIFSIISSLSLVTDDIKNIISSISHYTLIIAMSAIGLSIKFNAIKESGKNALKLASLVFFIQIVISIILIWLL